MQSSEFLYMPDAVCCYSKSTDSVMHSINVGVKSVLSVQKYTVVCRSGEIPPHVQTARYPFFAPVSFCALSFSLLSQFSDSETAS